MLKNYFKTAWRNLIKNKANSFINIVGLSVGMAVAILIGLWIWSELSFDKSFDNYSRIAQVMQTETLNGEVNTGKGNVLPLAAELKLTFKPAHFVCDAGWVVTAGDTMLPSTPTVTTTFCVLVHPLAVNVYI